MSKLANCFSLNTFQKGMSEYEQTYNQEIKLFDTWKDNKGVKALDKAGVDTNALYAKIYENTTGLSYLYGDTATAGQLRLLKTKLKKFDKGLFTNPESNKFKKWLYLPEVIASKNPITERHFDSMNIIQNYYRGNQEQLQQSLNAIGRGLAHDMNTKGLAGLMPEMSLKKAGAEIKRREQKWRGLVAEGRHAEAKKYFDKRIEPISKETEFEVINKAIELFQDPTKLKELAKKDFNDIDAKNKYGNGVLIAAEKWVGLRETLWKDLNKGLDNTIKTLELFEKTFNDGGELKGYFENIKANLKEQPNYVPKVLFDIFPTIERVNEAIFNPDIIKVDASRTEVYKAAKDLTQKVISEINPSSHVLNRGVFDSGNFSRDLLGVLDTYGKNVNRFNFTSRSTLEYVKAVKGLMGLEGSDLQNQSRGLLNFLNDTHGAAMGYHTRNAKFTKISRVITSLEFISKMFGLRGPARNVTQSVQNINHFGAMNIYRTYSQIASDKGLKKTIQKEMDKHGFQFVNVEELAVGRHDVQSANIKYDKNTGFEYKNNLDFGEKMVQFVENTARITGKPMQWVENHVNRNNTFKIAFVTEYNRLMKGKDIVTREVQRAEQMMGEADFQTKFTGENIGKKVTNTIERRASRFAANAVKDIHYLYDSWAKPKYFRTGVGAVQSQFSMYRWNHFNMTAKRHMKAWDEIKASRGNPFELAGLSQGFGMASRSWMTSMIITGLMGPMLGLDLGFLWQDDTLETAKNLNKYYRLPDTPEGDAERKKMFFGKGPLLGTVSGPFFGDLIKIGQLTQLIEMDEDNWATWLMGYKDFAELSEDEQAYENLKVANNFLARVFYKYPEIASEQGVFYAGLSELALYKTPNNEAKRKIILQGLGLDADQYKMEEQRMMMFSQNLIDKKGVSRYGKSKIKYSRGEKNLNKFKRRNQWDGQTNPELMAILDLLETQQ